MKPSWGIRKGIQRWAEIKEHPERFNPTWSGGNLLEKEFDELLAYLIQQEEPKGDQIAAAATASWQNRLCRGYDWIEGIVLLF